MQHSTFSRSGPAATAWLGRAGAMLAARSTPLLSGLVAVCFTTVLVLREVTDVAFVLLIVAGLGVLFVPRWRGAALPGAGRLHAAFVAYVGVAALVWLITGDQGGDLDRLGRYARFLLFSPLLLLFLRGRLAPWALWIGLVGGAVAAGAEAVQQAVIWEDGLQVRTRAEGESYAILFGDLSLAWGVMALAGIRWYRRRGAAWVALPLLAAAAGLVGSILSGTRGGWIALPAMAVVLLTSYWPELSRKARAATAAALIAVPAIAYVVPATGVAQRFTVAVEEMGAYVDGRREQTSTGLRLEMWRTAWGLFRAHPVLGAGLGGYYAEELRLIEAGRLDPVLGQFRQPHNEYLLALSTRGLLGFTALLGLFLVPGALYYRAIRSGGPGKDVGVAGLLVIIGFMHFGLTESVFDRALFISIYLFVIAVLSALVLAPAPDGDAPQPLEPP